jgi:hypothetical protein
MRGKSHGERGMLNALITLALLAGQPLVGQTVVKALRGFDLGDIPCELRVIGNSQPVPRERLTIACNHSALLTYDFGQGELVDIRLTIPTPNSSVRAFVWFEHGLMETLVVFEISSLQGRATAKAVYEHGSQNAAESLENGRVILEHVQRRFKDDGTILPGATNLYRWQDGRYEFVEGFRWNQGASWMARYCVLYRPESCPAERTKIRILDEYER